MGTDIFILVEVYDEENKNWVLVENNNGEYEPFHQPYPIKRSNENIEDYVERIEDYYESFPVLSVEKNYPLFSVLANVMNNYNDGLDVITPLSLPKGFPKDLSNETRILYQADEQSGIYHSYTWFSVEELKKINWYKFVIPHQVKKYYMRVCNFNKLLGSKLTIVNPINPEDLCSRPSEKIIKYARYRSLSDGEKQKLNDFFIEFNHNKLALENNTSLGQLMGLVRDVSQQYPKARLLMYFD